MNVGGGVEPPPSPGHGKDGEVERGGERKDGNQAQREETKPGTRERKRRQGKAGGPSGEGGGGEPDRTTRNPSDQTNPTALSAR